jgi:hypothetical protein
MDALLCMSKYAVWRWAGEEMKKTLPPALVFFCLSPMFVWPIIRSFARPVDRAVLRGGSSDLPASVSSSSTSQLSGEKTPFS